MRKLLTFFMLALAMCFIFAVKATAQDLTFPDVSTLTPETLFTLTVEPLYGLVVVLSGYLTAFIPGIKKWQPFYRVIAFALAIGVGLHLFGGSSVWKLAFTYFISTGLYEVFIKNIFKSPKAALSLE